MYVHLNLCRYLSKFILVSIFSIHLQAKCITAAKIATFYQENRNQDLVLFLHAFDNELASNFALLAYSFAVVFRFG